MELTLATVQRTVAEFLRTSVGELQGMSRYQVITQKRAVAMYLCRTLTAESLPAIGRAFHRDHSTIQSAVRKIEKQLKTDTALRGQLDVIRSHLIPSDPVELELSLPSCPACKLRREQEQVQLAREDDKRRTMVMVMSALVDGIKALERS